MIWTLLAHWVHLFLSGLSILLSPLFVKSFLFVFHNFFCFPLTYSRFHTSSPSKNAEHGKAALRVSVESGQPPISTRITP